jgi:predicted DCC family thiol-disulfide oxidoreductase YuxK
VTPAFKFIVFYDGNCALCHGFVRYILRADKNACCGFAPQQGELAAAILPQSALSEESVIVYSIGDGSILHRTKAVRIILKAIGSKQLAVRLLRGLLMVTPGPVADFCYDIVAILRKRLKPPPSQCPIVPIEIRERIIMNPSTELLQSLKKTHE